tara:strand:+ start:21638 stop:22216 length:579 start_codon:yes stop_codon:yes gene_type:complete
MFDLSSVFLIPIVIFLARIMDVSLGTLRIVMVSRGFKYKAAFLGFFEVLIWAFVVAELLKNLDNWINYIAYAGGFSAGTFVGMYIESKVKVGTIIVRIITQNKREELVESLKEAGFTITSIDAEGGFGPVNVIFTVLKRRRWNEVVSIIEKNDPTAFYSSEDVKFANSSLDLNTLNDSRGATNRLLGLRKGI